MKRKLYRDSYEIRTLTDPDTGRERKTSVYRGLYYRLALTPEQKTRMNVLHITFSVISIALFLLCGWMNLPSSRSFYVLPFYLFMLFPLFYRALAVFRFCRLRASFTAVDKDGSIDSLVRSSYGLAVLSVLFLLGDIVFLALGGAGNHIGSELLGLACIASVGSLAAMGGRSATKMEICECPKGA